MTYDILIIGAGAAGLFCASQIAGSGKKVVILEHQERVGKKILISGGGRCNFTNLYSKPENFLSSNPHFCKSALARFTPKDFVSLVEKYEIPYFEKKLGQLFCQVSAKEITNLLLKECQKNGVEIHLNCKIESINFFDNPMSSPSVFVGDPPTQQLYQGDSRPKACGNDIKKFILQTSKRELKSHSLVIATGGLSYQNLGATDFGYRIARQFGINIIEPTAALVPLLWKEEEANKFRDLSGVSMDTEVSCHSKKFRENILFTHQGLSGPAILQISSYWKANDPIQINLFPGLEIEKVLLAEKQNQNRSTLKNFLAQFLPKRFLEIWIEQQKIDSKPLLKYSDPELHRIAQSLHRWTLYPACLGGYDKAEVTRGGVDPDELSSKTMESKKIPNLYFIGEVIDVTGHLGGHNFQWAWASAHAAAEALSPKS